METYAFYKQVYKSRDFKKSVVQGRLQDSTHCIALIKCYVWHLQLHFFALLSDPGLRV